MSKLKPPYVESKSPAFYGKNMIIPFKVNRANSIREFESISVLIKTVQTNIIKATITVEVSKYVWYDGENGVYKVNVNLGDFEPVVGQYYKVQLAGVNGDGIGFYSDVTTIKCTAQPGVYIKDRENTTRNTYEYVGVYDQTGAYNDNKLKDPTEKVYYYRFDLYDENGNLAETSGNLLHNGSNDTETDISTDTWITRKALPANAKYSLTYSVETINGLQMTSNAYEVMEIETVAPNIHADLCATMNQEEGYMELSLRGDMSGKYVTGRFVLLRASGEDNFDSWQELTRFSLTQWSTNDIKVICRDFTVQHGVAYQYAIQAYNRNDLYSDRLVNVEGLVSADFEDMFLYDGEKQLKIRFNPKVSSFKSTVLEQKIDTIGGKYPFFFRNGNVEYKEFSISGLLSYVGDNNDMFMGLMSKEPVRERTVPAAAATPNAGMTQLTSDNFYKERQFKLSALEWLNNGKPKLFRSAAEGNYIVRLMNVSLTPTDSLGRMVHTFNATAYEIADYNFTNLSSFGLTPPSYVETRDIMIENWAATQDSQTASLENLNAINAVIANMPPNLTIAYTIMNDSEEKTYTNTRSLGAYNFGGEFLLQSPLLSVRIADDSAVKEWGKTTLQYSFYDEIAIDDFNYVSDIVVYDEVSQFIGTGSDVNIISDRLEKYEIKEKTGQFYTIKVEARNIKNLYLHNGVYYIDETYNSVFDRDTAEITTLYYSVVEKKYIDLFNNTEYDKIDFTFKMNDDTEIDFSTYKYSEQFATRGRYEYLRNVRSVSSMYAGNGVIVDVSYQIREFIYTVEETNNAVKEAKKVWLQCVEAFGEDYVATKDAYEAYYKVLESTLNEVKEMYSVESAL